MRNNGKARLIDRTIQRNSLKESDEIRADPDEMISGRKEEYKQEN